MSLSSYLKSKRSKKGFSLIELIISLLIISVIAGIAIPTYLNEKTRVYKQVSLTDGDYLNREILATIGDNTTYPTFGTTNGTISYNSTTSMLTVSLGAGATSPASFIAHLSSGSTISGITYANSTSWCIDVFNTTQSSIFTPTGLSSILTSCGVNIGNSNHFLNSSFETDGSNWSSCYNPGGLAQTINTSTVQAQLGSQSLLRTVITGTGASQMNICGNISMAYQANKTYTFSIYIYTNRTHTFYWALALNAVSGTTYPGASQTVTANTWTKVTYVATMPSDFISLTNIQLADSPVAGDLVYIDNAQSY